MSVAVGHPIDTIKNKMQAQEGYEARNAINSLVKTIRTQGLFGLYRGATPQFLGSILFRSMQFGVYHSVHSRMNNSFGTREIPFTGGLEIRVVLGGMASGIARATFETPIDYWKIRRQIFQDWKLQDGLKDLKIPGFQVTLMSRLFLLPIFFIYLDKAKPLKTRIFGESVVGNIFYGGSCATAAWWTIWPLEYMKSQIQGGYGDPKSSFQQRLVSIFREKGVFGLYRGLGPGSARSFLANGLSMAVFLYTKEHLTNYFYAS